VRLLFLVVLSPLMQYRPGVLDGMESVLVQAFVPELAVQAFDKRILCGLAGPDQLELDAVMTGPLVQYLQAAARLASRYSRQVRLWLSSMPETACRRPWSASCRSRRH
jgi:hypothetical protein